VRVGDSHVVVWMERNDEMIRWVLSVQREMIIS
jgi:hypothetical protein